MTLDQATPAVAPVGRRVGMRTVIGEAPRDAYGERRWVVRCDCGTESAVLAWALSRGTSKSCGCHRYEDFTGRTFGRLSVSGPAESKGGRRWHCVCECGAERTVYGSHLTRGNTTSCGCSREPQVPSYRVAHKRVSRARGPASLHFCVDCGVRATQWSYDHTDPDELTQQMKNRHGTLWIATYSTKPEHYESRCRPCHWAFDNRPEEQRR